MAACVTICSRRHKTYRMVWPQVDVWACLFRRGGRMTSQAAPALLIRSGHSRRPAFNPRVFAEGSFVLRLDNSYLDPPSKEARTCAAKLVIVLTWCGLFSPGKAHAWRASSARATKGHLRDGSHRRRHRDVPASVRQRHDRTLTSTSSSTAAKTTIDGSGQKVTIGSGGSVW